MSTSASASRRPWSSLPRRSSWCVEDTTVTILTDTLIEATPLGAITDLTDTIIGDTTLGAPTGTRIGTGATIIITGPPLRKG
jgi:hypothetical protein